MEGKLSAGGNPEVLQYGMVGGGEGAFIGDVHRKAASFDGKCGLVAGCFSRDFDNTVRTGKKYGIDSDRLYSSFEEMAITEGARNDKIDFVSIVTPNHMHYPIAKMFLENGISVVCDKPLCVKVEEAETLAAIAKEKGLLFCVTYTYSGYPMVRQARELIQNGSIGRIIMVMGEYLSDWMIDVIEKQGNGQPIWRTDPEKAGISNCIGDIGSHIENTVFFMTGLRIKSLCARLDSVGHGQMLDTNGSVLVRYDNGASGIYWASQVSIGYDNALKVRIFGTEGSIEWEQENPNILRVTYKGQPTQIMSRGRKYLHGAAAGRLPAGHPEGYYEAFSNIYSKFADALIKKKAGMVLDDADLDFPDVKSGLQGVRFIDGCVRSSMGGSIWVEIPEEY
jgi:predicted dehydrogenase